MSVQVMLNGVPLEEYETNKNFKEESRCHYLYHLSRPKYHSHEERSGPVRHLTREEIRQEYGVEKCPYTWEEIFTWLMENVVVNFNFGG